MLLVTVAIPPTLPATDAQSIPPPHLGYGIHLDPNLPPAPGMVNQLGMDWVKLYSDEQIPHYSDKRILFREDMRYRTDFDNVRQHFADKAAFLWRQGVDAIEIHNEPNLYIEWEPRLPNAREYVEILRAAYQGVKSTAPNMIVVSGGLAPTVTTPDGRAITDVDFARDMLAAGAANYFDAFGYHPYGYNAPPEAEPSIGVLNFRRTELIWELFEEFDVRGKQIWMTEFGWLRDPGEDGVACSDNDPDFFGFAWLRVDGQTQADYLIRAFQYADQNWEWAGPMFVWNLNFSMRPDGSLSQCNHQRWFGLLRRDGSQTLAYNLLVTMPKRYAEYLPTMTLYADDMTLETSVQCPGQQQVGTLRVANTGYPGSFTATVDAPQAPRGPIIQVSQAQVRSDNEVDIFVDTSPLDTGLYLIYVNVRATIGGRTAVQNVRGFVIIREGPVGSC